MSSTTAASTKPALPAGSSGPAPAKKVNITVTTAAQMPFWNTYRLGVVGAKEAGKTRLFATLSKHWKEDESGTPQPAFLSDILYGELDEGGMNCIREYGVDCPVIAMDELSDDDIFKALTDIPKVFAEEAKRIDARGVCVDTCSRLVKAILSVLIKQGQEGAQLYGALALHARKFFFAMRNVHCPIVYNFHVKPPPILEGKDEAGVRIASGLGSSELEIDVGGREAKQLIRDSCTHIYHLETKEMPGGKMLRQLSADSRVESKRRMQKYMLPVMPPNLAHFWAELARSMGIAVP